MTGAVAGRTTLHMAKTPPVPSRPPCRLYLITPPRISDLEAFAETLGEALGAGDVAALQIRLKDVSDAEVRRAVDMLGPVARAHGVAIILNDRADLASDCDGVHLGQQDGSVAEARRLLGPDAMIGVTCHGSRHLAMEAAEAGADYVAFGAFWQETMEVPCVAIGGVTAANAGQLARAGADFVAVSGAVWESPGDPASAVRNLVDAIRG